MQECRDVTRNVIISVPREITKQKCVNITVTACNDVEVQVPRKQCHKEYKPVCTVASHEKCFDVKKEVDPLLLFPSYLLTFYLDLFTCGEKGATEGMRQ